MSALNHHPFAVEALLARTTVLTFAAPAAALHPLLPAPFRPDTLGDWGFVAAAMVQTRQLRPRGLPAWLGQDFFLIGYRILVRYTTAAGKRLRGLYVLRSETDQRRMTLLGNVFTSYGYATVDITQDTRGSRQRIHSAQAGLEVVVDTAEPAPALPLGSPFESWQQARRFAGPLPFTFSYHPPRVLIVEGRREDWTPQPVRVEQARVAFVEALPLPELRLASAFTTDNIPYHWQKGRTELWTP